MLQDNALGFVVEFVTGAQFTRNQYFAPEFYADLRLIGKNSVKTTLLVPRHLIAEVLEIVCGYDVTEMRIERQLLEDQNHTHNRSRRVREFLSDKLKFYNFDVAYWTIFEGSEFFKEIQEVRKNVS